MGVCLSCVIGDDIERRDGRLRAVSHRRPRPGHRRRRKNGWNLANGYAAHGGHGGMGGVGAYYGGGEGEGDGADATGGAAGGSGHHP